MRFTIRDVLWLTVIAAVALGIGRVWLRADTVEEYAVTFLLFLAGATFYGATVAIVRRSTTP
jgi:hypothetical protein